MSLEAQQSGGFDFGRDQRVRADIRADIDESSAPALQAGANEFHVVVVVYAHGVHQRSDATRIRDAQAGVRKLQLTRKRVQQFADLPFQVAKDAADGIDAFSVRDLL